MTSLREVLDRLAGVHPVRKRLEDVAQRVEKLADLFLEHERRLVRMETKFEERLPRLERP